MSKRTALLSLLSVSSVLGLSLYCSELPVFALPPVTGAPVDEASPEATASASASDSNQAQAPAPSSSPSGASTTTGTPSGVLTGSVATTEQTAESILVELEQTVHHLKDASWGAFCEAQRPDVIYAGGPEVIGGMVINPIGGSGLIPTGGYLPPRKKWIDYYSMHVAYLAPLLKQELDSFKMPAGVSSDTMDDYQEYAKIGGRLPDLCDKMITACQGPKYDNVTISMAAGMLNEELKRYDKVRKEIYKDIREDYKKEAKEEKNISK